MSGARFPVFVFCDQAGLHTATPVEDLGVLADGFSEIAAVGESTQQALNQLKDYLLWLAGRPGGLPETHLTEIEQVDYRVPVRPEYSDGRRVFPAEGSCKVGVSCLHGKLDGGMRLACLPTLQIRFHYFGDDPLRELVFQRVQVFFKGMNTAQVSRFLAPASGFLTRLDVKLPKKRTQGASESLDPPLLLSLAEPLADRRAGRRFSPAWEREPELDDLMERMGAQRANLLLVGEAGVGKTTLLVEAVRRLRKLRSEVNAPNRFWLSSAARIISGMKYLGQWEDRCERLIDALSGIDGSLCVESLLDLIRVGGSGARDGVAAFLQTFIQAGELRLVAEVTPAELEACRRLLPGFVDLFQIVRVAALDRNRSLAVLERIGAQRKQNDRVGCEKGALELCHQLFTRFMPYAAMPGPAASFLQNAFDRVVADQRGDLSQSDVVTRFTRLTGLPEKLLMDDRLLSASEVYEALRSEVLGQDPACRLTAEVVAAFKAGMNDPARPIGVLLFCGPTGVGKTQLARSLSRFLFGHGSQTAGERDERLIRLDMSEYATPGSAERLLGDASGQPSELTRRIRLQPFSVVLLDEVEKAAPEVFDVLLNLLDEGSLTDAWGRKTNFRSAVVIMTSNLGARAREPIGFDEGAAPVFEREVRTFFRPEFVNRIDDLLSFGPLGKGSVWAIAVKELAAVALREGLAKRDLKLSWTDELIAFLVEQGFDKRYGARNLQRTIEERVVTPLAHWLLEESVPDGARVRVELDDNQQVTFSG